MDRETIKAKVLEEFSTVFPDVETVDTEVSLTEVYGVSSITIIEILVALESACGISFDDRELSLAKYPSLETLIDAVEAKLA